MEIERDQLVALQARDLNSGTVAKSSDASRSVMAFRRRTAPP